MLRLGNLSISRPSRGPLCQISRKPFFGSVESLTWTTKLCQPPRSSLGLPPTQLDASRLLYPSWILSPPVSRLTFGEPPSAMLCSWNQRECPSLVEYEPPLGDGNLASK